MKPWVAFAGGAVLAGTLALFTVPREQPEAEVNTPVIAQDVRPVEPVGAPEVPKPAPVVISEGPPAPAPRAAATPRATPAKPRKAEKPAVQEPPVTVSTTPRTEPTPASPTSPPPTTPGPAVAETQPVAPREEPKPIPPPEPNKVTIPAGTPVAIRLAQSISSDAVQPGEAFSATLDQPLVVQGFVLAERGARVTGKITESSQAGRMKGLAHLALELTSFRTSDGQTVEIRTTPFQKEGEKTTKSDATKVAVGAGVGAALGAIFGGGKGAAIGAGTGAAAGTGVVLATRGKPVSLPSETKLTFSLQAPVTIVEKR